MDGIKTSGFSKAKLRGYLKAWDEAAAEYLSANGAAMKKKKDAMEDILGAVDQIGVKKSVWRKAMETLKFRKKAKGIRGTIDDADTVDQFDVVCLALGIPLFDDEQGPAEGAEARAAAKAEKDEADKQKRDLEAAEFEAGAPH